MAQGFLPIGPFYMTVRWVIFHELIAILLLLALLDKAFFGLRGTYV